MKVLANRQKRFPSELFAQETKSSMIRIWFKRIFGVLAFLIGLALLGWFIYNQIWPTDEFKRGFRSVFQLAAPIACLLVGWSWMRYQGKGIEEVTPPDLKCPELDESVMKARETLSEFITEVEAGKDGCFIKFPFTTTNGHIEHVWSYVHFHRNSFFNVSIANELINPTEGADARRDVPADEIEDWQIMGADGTIRGAYSLIALFRHYEKQGKPLSPKMRTQKAQLLYASR